MFMMPRPDSAPPPSSPLAGRVVVVTGASDGVGKAAVRRFAQLGAEVVMIGRNEAKTAAAARSIMSETGSRTIRWEIADLGLRESVHELAERLQQRYTAIHVLANNAGAIFVERETTREGLERTFALNHLSYVQLALRLLPRLVAGSREGSPSRIINVSSRAHEDAKPDLEDLQGTRAYGGWRAYANSKLFNVWFTSALASRVDASRLFVAALHPGVVRTRFGLNNGRRGRLLRWLLDLNSISPDAGADTLVWLSESSAPLADQGGYFVKRQRRTTSRLARDTASAERLWRASAQLLDLDADAMVQAAMATSRP
jgi:NAD(P)-dependent dehydrogenase (short-subunit alcohol dehydrogenase family)